MVSQIFMLSVALIAFTYFGYPALLAAWSRMAPRSTQRERFTPTVTVVVVGHNEADAIAAKVESCLEQNYPDEKLRLLVVSDGSSDGMVAVVDALDNPRVRVLEFAKRRGKAACLNDALAACNDEFIVFCDVRQPLDRSAVRFLLENFADDTVGAVSGELIMRIDGASEFGAGIDAYWRYEKFIREQESRVGSTVGVTGALYALRRSLWQPIPEQTILDDVLIPMNVVMQGYRVLFDHRAVAWDRPSVSADQERTRKTRTLAGNFQLLDMRPDLLVPWRNPLFFQFVCHKVLRLLVPACMLLALLSNIVLAFRSQNWAILLGLQLACYALAMAGTLLPTVRRWLPTRVLTMFLLLNVFVVLGFIDFLFNKEAHLWRSHRRST